MMRPLLWLLAWILTAPAVFAQSSSKLKEEKPDLKVEGKLLATDPKDNDRKDSPRQIFTFRMQSGKAYVIDLTSSAFDAYLRLEDAAGHELAFNDDIVPGQNRNSRIVFKAAHQVDHRLIVTSFDGKSGAFTLTARVVKLDGPLHLAMVGGLCDMAEKAYQCNQRQAAARIRQQADATARKTALDYPGVAAAARELLFEIQHLKVGCAAQEIKGEDMDGKAFKLSDYRGKVVVLNFWGLW